MDPHGAQLASEPVFKKCVRCDYSLRGLPSRHACPECGLRFDENCGLYRVANPWVVALLWLAILVGGSGSLRRLRDLGETGAASWWQRIGLLAVVAWIIVVIVGAVFLVRHFRRGFALAVTGDGLFVRLPDWKEDVIPWSSVGGATVKRVPHEKPQVVTVHLTDRRRFVDFGGTYNVFPTRADAERFVAQVHEHLDREAGKSAVAVSD